MSRTLPSTRSTVWHESAHAAALCLQGLPPLLVRVDRPTDTQLGSCRPDWENHDLTSDNLRKLIIAVVAGALQSGPVTAHEWPLDDEWGEGCQRDGEQCQFLIDHLGLDRVAWIGVVCKAKALCRKRVFRELQVAIGRALEDKELLLRPEIEAISAGVIAEHGGI